jgi:hypothetical protein
VEKTAVIMLKILGATGQNLVALGSLSIPDTSVSSGSESAFAALKGNFDCIITVDTN